MDNAGWLAVSVSTPSETLVVSTETDRGQYKCDFALCATVNNPAFATISIICVWYLASFPLLISDTTTTVLHPVAS